MRWSLFSAQSLSRACFDIASSVISTPSHVRSCFQVKKGNEILIFIMITSGVVFCPSASQPSESSDKFCLFNGQPNICTDASARIFVYFLKSLIYALGFLISFEPCVSPATHASCVGPAGHWSAAGASVAEKVQDFGARGSWIAIHARIRKSGID